MSRGPVLITGGAGYIGSHAVRHLLEQHEEIVILDNLTFGHPKAVPGDPVLLVEGNVANQDLLERLFSHYRFDAVLHFAASTLVGDSMSDPLEYYRNNFGGPIALLEAMKDHGCRKLILASTCAIYGNPVEVPITEAHPQHPISPYGASKWMLERALRDCDAAWGLKSVSLRFFNASGCHASGDIGEDHRPETHLIPIVLQAALGLRDAVTIFGTDHDTDDGTCVRDYVHVCDIAEAASLALQHLRNGGGTAAVNLGTGRGASVRDIISIAKSVTGVNIPTSIGDRRPGDPPLLVADPSMARSVLGWTASRPDVRTHIEDAWRWFSGPLRGRYAS
jgi:UDP-glucose-4-epimerase GalE